MAIPTNQYSPISPLPARAFKNAMIFIDETNLFHRLMAAKLKLRLPLIKVLSSYLNGRQLIRAYIYTSPPHLEKAKEVHGESFLDGIRLVEGDAILTQDGNYKEKAVDALLVADLIYHAAVKNYDYALLVSSDTDFVHAIKRVDDFGCRTAVLGVCCDLPPRLKSICDENLSLTKEELINKGLVEEV